MEKYCEKCGDSFSCGAATGACWCQALPAASGLPDVFTDCLCSKCLAAFVQVPQELVENKDYYFDDRKNMVFTEHYHLKRGFCCKNNCRHCPY